MIRVNGAETPHVEDETVTELLARLGYEPTLSGVAVAVNGEVVPRARWAETKIAARAAVDIIRAVQGG